MRFRARTILGWFGWAILTYAAGMTPKPEDKEAGKARRRKRARLRANRFQASL